MRPPVMILSAVTLPPVQRDVAGWDAIGKPDPGQCCSGRNWNYEAEGRQSLLWIVGATSPWAGENVGAVLLPLKLYLPLILAFQFPHTAQHRPQPLPLPLPFVPLIRTGPAISSAFLWEVVCLFVNMDRSGEQTPYHSHWQVVREMLW